MAATAADRIAHDSVVLSKAMMDDSIRAHDSVVLSRAMMNDSIRAHDSVVLSRAMMDDSIRGLDRSVGIRYFTKINHMHHVLVQHTMGIGDVHGCDTDGLGRRHAARVFAPGFYAVHMLAA
eukprot:SAG11_NODE_4582_length_1844_cov_1.502579_1_plen_121_part_00